MIHKTFHFDRKRAIQDQSAAIIRYNEGFDQAPMIVAQAKGNLANKIIQLAKEQNIPLQEDSQFIGNLLDMDLGDSVPPQLYSVMAEIFLMIEEITKNA
ncbi:EscU/YscU/HrcU family type III secretion system export apparatus switch protein [Ammoniphilus resinae]|uniref:Flagellar biosynthesis protein n=1 Tax=Ammoniphilus resinae TaxID=861532 RepID=A0ABS4GMZ2_9BACL|nr:EscU/YscU/HrcU family type III secretion system export apparatus switch protein [Ammoniphilus resinae]MBP1931482.1 flagellar biosynthesis protein [Ammoniphilus resinae]